LWWITTGTRLLACTGFPSFFFLPSTLSMSLHFFQVHSYVASKRSVYEFTGFKTSKYFDCISGMVRLFRFQNNFRITVIGATFSVTGNIVRNFLLGGGRGYKFITFSVNTWIPSQIVIAGWPEFKSPSVALDTLPSQPRP
jgi:hypothetical protein